MIVWLVLIFIVSGLPAQAFSTQLTPLEAVSYQSLPDSAQISAFLDQLAQASPYARALTIGHSAGGRPLSALLLSDDPRFLWEGRSAPGKLVVMLVGGQHGTEPSGTEALQALARDVVFGPLKALLAQLDLILVPNANPDGRDLRRRVNSHGKNLSTDYVVLSQPESLSLVRVLNRFRPHALLDIHESAVLKRKSLGAQGYLTDFEAQFEFANHVNVDPKLRRFAEYVFLPELLEAVKSQGLPAQHYIGEITSVNQVITHGGISLRNLRNYAGMRGTFAFLVENRLDPPGNWPTPRNIQARVAKQRLCLLAFLEKITQFRHMLLERVEQVRSQPGQRMVALGADYQPRSSQPKITIGLRSLESGREVAREFEYHGRIVAKDWVLLPRAYAITAHQTAIACLLDRHAIGYQKITKAQEVTGACQRIAKRKVKQWFEGVIPRRKVQVKLQAQVCRVRLAPGDLLIDLRQPEGALAFLLLDPCSSTSIFHDPAYASLLVQGERFFGIPLLE